MLSGDISATNELLGQPFSFTGVVGHGQKLGRKIGFPTANIQILDQPKYPLIDQRKSLLFLMAVGAMIGLFIGLMASVYIYTDK